MLASFGRELVAWMTGNYTADRRIAASSSLAGVVGGVHHNHIHTPDEELEMAVSENLPAALQELIAEYNLAQVDTRQLAVNPILETLRTDYQVIQLTASLLSSAFVVEARQVLDLKKSVILHILLRTLEIVWMVKMVLAKAMVPVAGKLAVVASPEFDPNA